MARKEKRIPLGDFSQWEAPLMRVLEGHSDLLSITSDFPNLGKLPSLGKLTKFEMDLSPYERLGGQAASPIVAVVVVVVCVAVAARPGAVTSPEILRAKLLDVYSPKERVALREAIAVVQKNPELIKSALGIDHTDVNKILMDRLEQVQQVLY